MYVTLHIMNGRSIRKKASQIKHSFENNREFVFSLIIILVAFAAFGLGRLSAIEEAREPVRLTNTQHNVQSNRLEIGGRVVASRYGSKYHAPWCGGADRISERNKIWFKDEQAARKAGYTPAGNCKGLK